MTENTKVTTLWQWITLVNKDVFSTENLVFSLSLSHSLSPSFSQNFLFSVKIQTVFSGEELSQGLYPRGNRKGVRCSI